MFDKFGIEIEMMFPNGVDFDEVISYMKTAGIKVKSEEYNHTTKKHWKFVTDGSLSYSGMYGRELVSPPLPFEESSFEEIRKITKLCRDKGAKIKSCCGLHVHIDATGAKPSLINKIIERYGKYEDKFDSIMPSSRRQNNNSYCQSVKNRAMRGDPVTIDAIPLSGGRHYKVNINSFVRQGTIEFRHHSGTLNADKIINWVKLVQAFCHFTEIANPTCNNPVYKKLPDFCLELNEDIIDEVYLLCDDPAPFIFTRIANWLETKESIADATKSKYMEFLFKATEVNLEEITEGDTYYCYPHQHQKEIIIDRLRKIAAKENATWQDQDPTPANVVENAPVIPRDDGWLAGINDTKIIDYYNERVEELEEMAA